MNEIGIDLTEITTPPHYTKFSIEVIDITRHLSFINGNILKYIARSPFKRGKQDLLKALQYIKYAKNEKLNKFVTTELFLINASLFIDEFSLQFPELANILSKFCLCCVHKKITILEVEEDLKQYIKKLDNL